MSEPLLRHQVVGLECRLKVFLMDTNGAPHQHVLGSLGNLSVHFEQVGSLQSLEAEEVILEVARVGNLLVDSLVVLNHDLVDFLGKKWRISALLVFIVVELVSHILHAIVGSLVESLDGDSVGQHRVVGVHDCHVGARLSRQICDFLCRDT